MGLKKIFAFSLAACTVSGFLIFTGAEALQMPDITNDGIQAQVNTVFAGIPDMIAVAKCESNFREYSNGQVLRGGTGGNYIGVFQISNSYYQNALSLGFDIYTTEGNIGYAKYMYDQRGTAPWSGCAPTASTAPPPPSPSISTTPAAATATPEAIPASSPVFGKSFGSLTANLQFGMVSPQVLVLQQILNASEFQIAQNGPGSPGSETTRFGVLTKAAVQRFQCAKMSICSGSESDTGYGRVGPKTRAALSAFSK